MQYQGWLDEAAEQVGDACDQRALMDLLLPAISVLLLLLALQQAMGALPPPAALRAFLMLGLLTTMKGSSWRSIRRRARRLGSSAWTKRAESSTREGSYLQG
jgi:hypothetical protein